MEERVIYVTLEAENTSYENTTNAHGDIDTYMISIGFVRHASPNTDDPTYFNPRFADYIKSNNVQIYQKG